MNLERLIGCQTGTGRRGARPSFVKTATDNLGKPSPTGVWQPASQLSAGISRILELVEDSLCRVHSWPKVLFEGLYFAMIHCTATERKLTGSYRPRTTVLILALFDHIHCNSYP